MMKKEDKFGLRSEICTLSGALYVVSASETQLIQGVCASTQLKLAPGLFYTIIKNYSHLDLHILTWYLIIFSLTLYYITQ